LMKWYHSESLEIWKMNSIVCNTGGFGRCNDKSVVKIHAWRSGRQAPALRTTPAMHESGGAVQGHADAPHEPPWRQPSGAAPGPRRRPARHPCRFWHWLDAVVTQHQLMSPSTRVTATLC
jgi:hypothetical protein